MGFEEAWASNPLLAHARPRATGKEEPSIARCLLFATALVRC